MKYQERAKSKEWFEFTCTKAIYDKFGFFPCQRVLTPKGPAVVIGQYRGDLWFHIDGDSGASYWSTYNSKQTFQSGGFSPMFEGDLAAAVERDDPVAVAKMIDSGELFLRGREESLFEFVISYGDKHKVLNMLCTKILDASQGFGGQVHSVVGIIVNQMSHNHEDEAHDAVLLKRLKIIVDHGADVKNPEMVHYLIEKGGDLKLRNHKQQDVEDVAKTLSAQLPSSLINRNLVEGVEKEMKDLSLEKKMPVYLPREMFVLIFSFLYSIEDRIRASLVCKHWNEIIDSLWKQFCEERWPDYVNNIVDEVALSWKQKAFRRARLEQGILGNEDFLLLHQCIQQDKKVVNVCGKIMAPETIGVAGYVFSKIKTPNKIIKNAKKLGLDEDSEKKCTQAYNAKTGNTVLVVDNLVFDDWKEG